jgi:LuxR family transcriptional regulator, maltose regulon positive regulatory protein
MPRRRKTGNLPAVAADVRELQAMTEVADASRPGLGADLRALALISLGGTEYWAAAPGDAARHLESGVALARRIRRPYLEFTGLVHWAAAVVYQSFRRAVELGTQAAELARRHGWSDDPAYGFIASVLAGLLTWQARLEEAEPWLQAAERALGDEAAQPAASALIRFVRGALEMMRNRDAEALTAFRAADLLARRLSSPHYLIPRIRALLLLAMVRLGQTGPAGQYLAGLSDTDREHGEIRAAEAALRLAQDDPLAAAPAPDRPRRPGRRDLWHARRARGAWGDGRAIQGPKPPRRRIPAPREQAGPRGDRHPEAARAAA